MPSQHKNYAESVQKLCRVSTKIMPSQHENYAESVPKLYGIKKVFCFCKKKIKRGSTFLSI